MALTTNLEAYWKLDGNSNDATANGHNGTDTSMSYSTTHAVILQAGQFNGSTSKILIPDAAGLDGTTALTLTGWFFTSGTPNGTLIGKSDASAAGGTYIRLDMNGAKLNATSDGDIHAINGGTTLSASTRYFAALTYDGTNLNLYLNGVTDAAQQVFSHAVTPGTGHLGIGVLGDFGQIFSGGTIDEVGFWSRGLSSSEISQLYNSGNGFTYPFVATSGNSNFLAIL